MFTLKFDDWVKIQVATLDSNISELLELNVDYANPYIEGMRNKKLDLQRMLYSELKPVYATMDEDEYFEMIKNLN